MSTYKSTLPEVFPFCANLEIAHCRIAIDLLMSSHRKDAAKGSSFAVTVDGYNGTWNLWLSKTSYDFLHRYRDLNITNRVTWNRFKESESGE